MNEDASRESTDAATGRSEFTTIVGVGAGGAAGAAARWLIVEAVGDTPADEGGFPWGTLLVNVLGCLLVGFAARRLRHAERAHAVVVTGVLGGFTTMSAVAVELNALAEESRIGVAAIYLTVTLGAGFAAVLVGSITAGDPRWTSDEDRS
ncbi:MAG: CrcB family protein [Ilumatobacter sp.]